MTFLYLRGALIGKIKAVLFDKDGTLCYSQPNLEILAQARIFHSQQIINPKERNQLKCLLEAAYGVIGGRVESTGAVAVASRHHNLIATATVFCQVGIKWPTALRYASRVFQYSDKRYNESNQRINEITEGLLPCLKALKSKEIICAIITNDTEKSVWEFLKYHDIDSFIQIIWSSNNQPSKPSPQVIYHICEVLRVRPDQCMIVSDADTDLYMCESAGIGLTIGYMSGWSEETLLDYGKYYINSWSELEIIDY